MRNYELIELGYTYVMKKTLRIEHCGANIACELSYSINQKLIQSI